VGQSRQTAAPASAVTLAHDAHPVFLCVLFTQADSDAAQAHTHAAQPPQARCLILLLSMWLVLLLSLVLRRYKGQGRTSHCYRVVYRAMDRSLTNDEVDALQQLVRRQTARQLGVALR
jgi:hypothetical protein